MEATYSHPKPGLAPHSWIPTQPPPVLPIHSLLVVLRDEEESPTTHLRGRVTLNSHRIVYPESEKAGLEMNFCMQCHVCQMKTPWL